MHLVVCDEAQNFVLSCLSFRPLAMLVGLSGHGPSHILQRPHVSWYLLVDGLIAQTLDGKLYLLSALSWWLR